jgi:hypothetical protein
LQHKGFPGGAQRTLKNFVFGAANSGADYRLGNQVILSRQV